MWVTRSASSIDMSNGTSRTPSASGACGTAWSSERFMSKKYRHSSKPNFCSKRSAPMFVLIALLPTSPGASGCLTACNSAARSISQCISAVPTPRRRHWGWTVPSVLTRSMSITDSAACALPYATIRPVGPQTDGVQRRIHVRIVQLVEQVLRAVVLTLLVDLLLGGQQLRPRVRVALVDRARFDPLRPADCPHCSNVRPGRDPGTRITGGTTRERRAPPSPARGA